MRLVPALIQKSVSLVPWRLRGTVKRVPLVAPLQRWLVARFLEGREFIHAVDAGPAAGLIYPIRLPEDKGIWTGTYELELATRISRVVRRGDVCFDIGGWRGFFSGVMALAGASKTFIFEPLPANAAQIRRTIALNPKLPIELIDAAVGEQEGMVTFSVMPDSSMGKLVMSPFQADAQGESTITVRVVALDQLIASGKLPSPTVIKIDVEGAEMLVLRGARRLLTDSKPKLFIEVHSPALDQECRALLTELSYEIAVLEKCALGRLQPDAEVWHLIAESRS